MAQTIKLINKKSYASILSAPYDLYIRDGDAGGSFSGLGWTEQDKTSLQVQPLDMKIDRSAQIVFNNRLELKTALLQSDAAQMALLVSYFKKPNLEIVFIHEPLSDKNFVLKNCTLAIDGQIDLSSNKARAIPLTIRTFSSDGNLFPTTLVTQAISMDDFVANDYKNIPSQSDWITGDKTSFGGKTCLTFAAEKGGFYKTVVSPNTFDAKHTAFHFKANMHMQSENGNELGLAVVTADDGDASATSYAYFILNYNYKIYVWRCARSTGATVLIAAFSLPLAVLATQYELSVKIIANVMAIYQNTTLVGSLKLDKTDANGYQVGVHCKAHAGGSTSGTNYIYDLSYTSDLT